MTTQLIAILASAGLVTAGVAAASETRSAAAMPVASLVSHAKTAHTPGISVARQGHRPDCSLPANADLPACTAPGAGGAGGASGTVLAGLAAIVGAGGLYVALKNDSNG